MHETDLFEPVKDLLIASGMEVYTEVPCGKGRADVVATKDKLVTIVELKTSLSLQLLEQAYYHLGEAHFTYIAVPRKKGRWFNHYALMLMKRDGIGLIGIDVDYHYAEMIRPAKFFRRIKKDWTERLRPEYRFDNNLPGGSAGGGYWTPYRHMMESVKRFISRKSPEPVSIAEIIEHVELASRHYVNPKSGIYGALTRVEKDWCEMVKIDGKTHFRLRETN